MKSKIQSVKERVVSFFDPKGIEIEMLRYRPNKASYKMTLFGIIAFALAFAIHYSGTSISGSGGSFSFLGSTNLGFWNFFDILLNILLLLFFPGRLYQKIINGKGRKIFLPVINPV